MCWIYIALFPCPVKDLLKGSLSVVLGELFILAVFDARLASLLQFEISRLFSWRLGITQQSPQYVRCCSTCCHVFCGLMPCNRLMLEAGIS